ncbi:MAG: hypothetical protein DDT42_01927 [candidate division WS2 bacterium]|uniref:Uncharacterized protein n=1 Tax=Psychracetigena formicireducens TaxID=2986056 RepID=A0A9E2BI72_PSYF1|nr:hypothetical protein [Candidatus Psychracetigena formicireducens]
MNFESVNFTNIDDEDFSCEYDNEIITVKAGETKAYPEYITVHLCKHLADKILTKQRVQNYKDPILVEPLIQKMKGEVVLRAEPEQIESEKIETEPEIKEPEFEELKEKTEQSELTEGEQEALEKYRAKVENLRKAREAKE